MACAIFKSFRHGNHPQFVPVIKFPCPLNAMPANSWQKILVLVEYSEKENEIKKNQEVFVMARIIPELNPDLIDSEGERRVYGGPAGRLHCSLRL